MEIVEGIHDVDCRKAYEEYIANAAAVENADPNFCRVVRKWFGLEYYGYWCEKHQSESEHVVASGRSVCDVYASSEPGCDPIECCARETEGDDE